MDANTQRLYKHMLDKKARSDLEKKHIHARTNINTGS